MSGIEGLQGYRHYGIHIMNDILFLYGHCENQRGLQVPVANWIRTGIGKDDEIGDFIQSCPQTPEDSEIHMRQPMTMDLVPTFLFGEVGATTWNEFASVTSFCYVMYRPGHIIVRPHLRTVTGTDRHLSGGQTETVSSLIAYRHLLAMKREIKGEITAAAIRAVVSEGARQAWVADRDRSA